MSYHFGDDLLDFVADSETLRAAEKLVRENRVLRVRRQAEAGGPTRVTGMVEGDFGYYFPARLTLTPEGDGVETYACDCRDFRADRALCVHCTALILFLAGDLPAPAPETELRPADAPEEPAEASAPEEPFIPREMEITLGTDDETGEPLIWRPNNTAEVFHTNTGVIGTMGTGKTQFTKALITQLLHSQERNFDGQPLGILIFDYKGDYNESKADFVNAVNAKIYRPYHLPFSRSRSRSRACSSRCCPCTRRTPSRTRSPRSTISARSSRRCCSTASCAPTPGRAFLPTTPPPGTTPRRASAPCMTCSKNTAPRTSRTLSAH